MSDLLKQLSSAPPAMMVSPYFNIADKHYVSREVLALAIARISELEKQVSALEIYLDRAGISRSGVPLTK